MVYVLFLFIFSGLVAAFADSRKRSGLLWFITAFLISPILAFIILLCIGEGEE